LLKRVVDAIDRAGVSNVVRLGLFDETAAYQGSRNTVKRLPASTKFDMGASDAVSFFWGHNMTIARAVTPTARSLLVVRARAALSA
jgi:Domain of unknown function (DUF5010)